MSDLSKVAFSESLPPGHPHDLLARLYREIGISAVAAALEVISAPEASEQPAEPNEEMLPPVLREDRAA